MKHARIELKIAFLLLAMSILLPASCGKGSKPGPAPLDPLKPPPKPSGQAQLIQKTADTYRWSFASDPSAQTARVVIDNGYDVKIKVTIDGVKAMDIEPFKPAYLLMPRGTYDFAALGPDGAKLDSYRAWIVNPSATYFYNPGACWAYEVKTGNYSTEVFLGGTSVTRMKRQVFFRTDADLIFEELPESITVKTQAGAPFAGGMRRSIHHFGPSPHPAAKTTRIELSPDDAFVLAEFEGLEFTLTTESYADAVTSALFIDNRLGDAARVSIDGRELFTVAAGGIARIAIRPGPRDVTASGASGNVLDTAKIPIQPYTSCVFNLQGRGQYWTDEMEYSITSFGAGAEKAPRLLLGKRVFELKTDFAFEDFPVSVTAGSYDFQSTRTRTMRDMTPRTPLAPEEGVNAARLLLEQGKIREAIETCLCVIIGKPDCAAALCHMGQALVAAADIEGAQDAFTTAIAADPNFADAYKNRARLAILRTTDPTADISQALKLSPDDTEALLLRAMHKRMQKDYAGARAECDGVLSRAQDHAQALALRAAAWLDEMNNDKAVEDAGKAIAADANCALAYVVRSRVSVRKLEDGSSDAETATNLAPSDPEANLARGICCVAQKDYTSARTYLNNYFETVSFYCSQDAEAFAAMGEALLSTGSPIEAKRYLERAVELLPALKTRIDPMLEACR
jgi:tetratricopeptide (TPR) repeat protein